MHTHTENHCGKGGQTVRRYSHETTTTTTAGTPAPNVAAAAATAARATAAETGAQRGRWGRGRVMAVALMAVLICACEGTPTTPLMPTIGVSAFADIDIGPVVFYTRLPVENVDDLTAEEFSAIFAAYDAYGLVEPMWLDKNQQTLEISVHGARLEYGGSFIQENLDLAESGMVPWRLRRVRYRANFAARQVSFRFRGRVDPSVSVEMDGGDGFHQVALDENGAYDVLLPFSPTRQFIFFRMQAGEVVQYGQIRAGETRIWPISFDEYQRVRRESVIVPEVPVILPEPEIGMGDDDDPWPQTRPQTAPHSVRHPDARPPSAADSMRQRRSRPADFAEMAEFPPKVLTRQISIEVHLVFDGLTDTDPLIDELRNLLRPFGYQFYRFDAEARLLWIFCRVLDAEDIRRLHHAVASFAEQREVSIVPVSRYFGVQMELVRLRGEISTTLRGRIAPGATLELFLGPGEAPIRVPVDAHGRYQAEIRPTDGPIYGIVTQNSTPSHVRIDIFTGRMTPIDIRAFKTALKIPDAPENEPPQ